MPFYCAHRVSPLRSQRQRSYFTANRRAKQPSKAMVPHVDLMDTRNFRLIDYRRMLRNGQTPTSQELIDRWRGVNKGIVELAGYKQFIKEIVPQDCKLSGDNIMVHQVSYELLRERI